MIGDYSFMDLATFLTALIALFGVLNSIIRNSRDTSAILREFTAQSEEHDDLSEEHNSIKDDTKSIRSEMLVEKMARENLYQNTTRAKEILETMDMMKEVVIQNSKLNAEIVELKVENQNLLNKENDKYFQLTNSINSFKNQLAKFEGHGESEDIRVILRKIEAELSEYVD